MRRLVLLAAVGTLAVACSGRAADLDDEATEPIVDSSTSAATSTSTTGAPDSTTTTTEAPPEPSGAVIGGEEGVAVIAGPQVLVNRTDGSANADVPPCPRPVPWLTDTALVLWCDGSSETVSIPFAGGPPVSQSTAPIVAAGDSWLLVCPAAGSCAVLDTGTLAPLALSYDIPGGEAPWINSGLGDLLVVGRDDTRALYSVDGAAVKRIRAGTADASWGGLVRLADGTTAMEIQTDTGGSDTRPEEIHYLDPITAEVLAYDDGADNNRLFDIGVGSVRVHTDVTLQRERVRAFSPDGTELWAWPDDESIAAGVDGRAWLATPGSDTIVEIEPRTGAVIDEIVLPGAVVDRTLEAHIAGWLVTRIDGAAGEQVVLVAV